MMKCQLKGLANSVRYNEVSSYRGSFLYILPLPTCKESRPGPVDFAIGLVNSVLNLPDGKVMFFEEFE